MSNCADSGTAASHDGSRMHTAGLECAIVESAAWKRLRSERIGYLAREPILDRHGIVFGYQLHFHRPAGDPEPYRAATGTSGSLQDARGILDSLALYGVERFTGGAWGFVPCSLDVLKEELTEGLPSSQTVLEIPPCAEVPGGLLRECYRLREMGFRLALSDFAPDDTRRLLLPIAQYVKVAIAVIDSSGWSQLCNQLARIKAFLIATHVHNNNAYRKARAGGLQYFQGFYFCNPELFPNGTVPADRAHHLEILRELFKDPLDLKTLCPLVSRDPSLVYRVLRFVNSPACAVRNPVTSIETALVIVGDAIFRRIATLAIQCTLSQDRSPELLRMAQIRASFCAEAAQLCSFDSEEMYLLGMLSLLPAMLRVPMQTILPNLPLRREICQALAGLEVRERCLLAWLEALEANDIAECEQIAGEQALDKNALAQLYLDALENVAREAPFA